MFELSENARRPYSQIGRKIRLSQQLVSYKVKSYMKSGLIKGFYPLVDYSKIGYLSFIVFFKINYANKEHFMDLISKISKNEAVIEVTECGGRYDIITVFSAKNPSSFNKAMKELIFDYSQSLKDYMILTGVVAHNFPRKYLLGIKNNVDDIIVGGDREPVHIDDTNKKILQELQENAAKPSLEISSKLMINPKTVISRIKSLEQLGVVKGYKPLLNIQVAGYRVNKIFLKLHNTSREREKSLLSSCRMHPNITDLIKLFGEWDVEITVETKTIKEFRDAYIMLREEFQDIIKDVESFPVFRTYKKQYIPEEFFKQRDSNSR